MGGRGVNSSKVMTEEEYLTSKGYPFMGYSEAGLHISNSNVSKRQQKQNIQLVQQRAREYDNERARFRTEYNQKIKSGELRKPTLYEEALKKSKGNPDNSDVQAARRLLQKLKKK